MRRLAAGAILLLNLMLVMPAVYMMQVFDRVFASRSLETLAMLSLLVALALALGYAMDVVRSRALAWAGALVDRHLSPAALRASLQRASLPARSREADAQAATAALYRQGEIHRLRGEFAEAEARYRDAARAGLEPQPGFALLRAAQGRHALARAAIHRVLASTREPLRRAALLPAQVDVLLESGDVDGAIAACRELEDISNRFRGDVLLALAAFARGSVELARGQAEASLAPLRTAFGTWQRLDAPYEAARVRALLGRAGRMLGDEEAATLDLDAAKGAFATLGFDHSEPVLRQPFGHQSTERRFVVNEKQVRCRSHRRAPIY